MPKTKELSQKRMFVKKESVGSVWINKWNDLTEARFQENKTRFLAFLKDNYGQGKNE